MNIVILGAGEIGSYLAKTLADEEHNVIVIDRDPQALERVGRIADVGKKLGSGTDWQLLESLLELSPDLFIALSSQDETNLVACAMAKNLGFPKTVARVHHPSFLNRSRLDFARLFFVDHFIGTEMILAHDLFKSIMNPGCSTILNFAHGAVQMRSIMINEKCTRTHCPLSELNLPENLLIGLIHRKPAPGEDLSKARLIFPRGYDILLPGDEVTLIGEKKVMLQQGALFGIPHKQVRSAVIAGGTPVALQVCQILEEEGIQVRLIEPDATLCHALAKRLPRTTIFNQDPTDLNFLVAEKIPLSDVFVACFSSDENNILSASIAKQAGCEEVIALLSEENYAPLLRRLGIYYTLSERVSVSNRIHAILQEESILSVASLYNNQAKILEVKVSESSELVGIPIAELSGYLPDDFLIALIENRGRIMIARGSNILAPGDTVIILTHPKHIPELQKIF